MQGETENKRMTVTCLGQCPADMQQSKMMTNTKRILWKEQMVSDGRFHPHGQTAPYT